MPLTLKSPARRRPAVVPPLQQGDRLTRDEFERRYQAMPDVNKAELIEGVVHMPSPVGIEHAESHFDLLGWLAAYRVATAGVRGGDNASVRLDLKNMPQPDGYLRLLEECGGQAKAKGKFVVGAPELIVEVASSSASYDLHDKLEAYRRNGVREYVVWRVWDEAVDWFALRGGKYQRLRVSGGIYKSKVFPGLWLDSRAFVRGDIARVMKVLQDGLASTEHQEFVEKLGKRK